MGELKLTVTRIHRCKVAVDNEQFAELLNRYTHRLRHMSVDDAQTLAAVELREALTGDCHVDLDVRANGVKLEPDQLQQLQVPSAGFDPLPHS